VKDLRAWILERHRDDEQRVARALYRDRMAAACAAPWATDEGPAERPAGRSEIAAAVEAYAAAHYQPGDDDIEFGSDPTPLFETAERASLYLGLCKEQTGDTIPDDELEKRRRDARRLLQQAHDISAALERGGFPAYRTEGFSLWHYYVHSGHLEKIPQFRRVIINPVIAQSTRFKMLSNVEFFMQKHLHCRLWTFTSGIRCNVLQLRERIQYLHRRLSQLNAQPFMRNAGVSIVFRSTELGTPKLAGAPDSGLISCEDGVFFFHPHAHTLTLFRKHLTRKQFGDLLSSVKTFWGHHWDDGGEIDDGRELVKYCTKPGEVLKLDTETLVALARETSRLKLVSPMGILRDEIKARRGAGKRVIRTRTPDGPVLREVLDWNRVGPSTDEEKDRAAAQKLDSRDGRPVTRVVSRLLPAIGPAGVKEPRAVIMTNEALDVALLRRHPAIAPMIACSAAEFSAGVAIRVHTCTPTVLPGLDVSTFSAWKPPDPGSIAEFFGVSMSKPTPILPNIPEKTGPKEGDRVTVAIRAGYVREITLGRAWVSKAGTVRFDIAPGDGFRPGVSVDHSQILMGASR
jgi:hypothetical protein